MIGVVGEWRCLKDKHRKLQQVCWTYMGDLLGRKKVTHEIRRTVVITYAHLKVGGGRLGGGEAEHK